MKDELKILKEHLELSLLNLYWSKIEKAGNLDQTKVMKDSDVLSFLNPEKELMMDFKISFRAKNEAFYTEEGFIRKEILEGLVLILKFDVESLEICPKKWSLLNFEELFLSKSLNQNFDKESLTLDLQPIVKEGFYLCLELVVSAGTFTTLTSIFENFKKIPNFLQGVSYKFKDFTWNLKTSKFFLNWDFKMKAVALKYNSKKGIWQTWEDPECSVLKTSDYLLEVLKTSTGRILDINLAKISGESNFLNLGSFLKIIDEI